MGTARLLCRESLGELLGLEFELSNMFKVIY